MKYLNRILGHISDFGTGWSLATFQDTSETNAIKSALRRIVGSKIGYSICAEVRRIGGGISPMIN